MKCRLDALLLVGPTGSGKTPLGEQLERAGLWGRRCFHFDFGASLRRIAASEDVPPSLTEADRAIILDSLHTGKLLENETFYIARAILEHFVRTRAMRPEDLLVLNGLPRHLGQAHDVDALVDIRWVVHLQCPPEVVRVRIQTNAGGDRIGRADDAPEVVEKKLRLFRERTLPLLDHYRRQGARILTLPVAVNTTPEEMHQAIEHGNV